MERELRVMKGAAMDSSLRAVYDTRVAGYGVIAQQRLHFQKLLQAPDPVLAAVTGSAVTTERCALVPAMAGLPPAHTCCLTSVFDPKSA